MKMGQPEEHLEKATARTGPRQSMVARLVSSIRRIRLRTRCLNCLRTTSKQCQIKETRDQGTQVDVALQNSTATQCEIKTVECGTQWCKQAAYTVSTQTALSTSARTELKTVPNTMTVNKMADEAESDLSNVTAHDSAQPKSTLSVTTPNAYMEVSQDYVTNGTRTASQIACETHPDHTSSSSSSHTAEAVLNNSVGIEKGIFRSMEDEDETPDITLDMEEVMKELDNNTEGVLPNGSNADAVADNTNGPTHETDADVDYEIDIEKEILSATEDEEISPGITLDTAQEMKNLHDTVEQVLSSDTSAHAMPNSIKEHTSQITHRVHADHSPPISQPHSPDPATEEEILDAMEDETPDFTLDIMDAMNELDITVKQDLSNVDKSFPLPGTFTLRRSISSPGFHHIERDPPNKEIFLAEARQSTSSLQKLDAGAHRFDPYPEFSFKQSSLASCPSPTTASLPGITNTATKGEAAPPNSVQELSVGILQPPVTMIEEAIRALEHNISMCNETLSDIETDLFDAMQEDSVETQVSGSLEAKDPEMRNDVPKNGTRDMEENPAETKKSNEATDDSSDDIAFDIEEAMMDLENNERPSEEPDGPNTTDTFYDQKDIPLPGTFSLTRSLSSPGFYHIDRDPPNTELFWTETRGATRSLYKLDIRDYNFDPEEELLLTKNFGMVYAEDKTLEAT